MIQIKRKKDKPVLEKRLFSKTYFTSALAIAIEIPKTKRKNPDKMCQLIHSNRNILYTLLEMSSHTLNFTFQTSH